MMQAKTYFDGKIELDAAVVEQIRDRAIELTCEVSMPDGLSDGYADTPEELSCLEPGSLSAACEEHISGFAALTDRQKDTIVDDLLHTINPTV